MKKSTKKSVKTLIKSHLAVIEDLHAEAARHEEHIMRLRYCEQAHQDVVKTLRDILKMEES